MYYIIVFWGFSAPPPFVIKHKHLVLRKIFVTPLPPRLWLRNTWMFPNWKKHFRFYYINQKWTGILQKFPTDFKSNTCHNSSARNALIKTIAQRYLTYCKLAKKFKIQISRSNPYLALKPKIQGRDSTQRVGGVSLLFLAYMSLRAGSSIYIFVTFFIFFIFFFEKMAISWQRPRTLTTCGSKKGQFWF